MRRLGYAWSCKCVWGGSRSSASVFDYGLLFWASWPTLSHTFATVSTADWAQKPVGTAADVTSIKWKPKQDVKVENPVVCACVR